MVRFTYGNTWSEVKKPGVKSGHKLTNSWSMQLSINDGRENVGKYIQSVMYELHPTYRSPNRRVTEAPFRIATTAWGYFDVTMRIKFKPKFKQPDAVLVHNLCFKPNGMRKSIFLEVDEPIKGSAKDKTAFAEK